MSIKPYLLIFALIIYTTILSSKVDATGQELTESDVTLFFKQGYLIVPNLFSAEEIRQISEAASRLQEMAEELSNTQTGKVMYKGSQFVIDKIDNKIQIHRVVWAGGQNLCFLNMAG